MASTFFGLNIAYSGLQTYQTAVNATAHNISNVKTEGYSRQQVDIKAGDALRVYSSYGCVGQGVNAVSIERVRDSYYDEKYRNNQSRLGEYEVKDNYMTQMEDYLNEFSIDGFTTEYDSFFAAVDELQKDPTDDTRKNRVISSLRSMSEYFNELTLDFKNLQIGVNQEIKNKVEQINTIAENIATLNKQINVIEVHGSRANDLRDSRDALIDKLSKIVNIDVDERELGNGATTFDVRINGQELVDTYNFNRLAVIGRDDKRNVSDAESLYEVEWENGVTFNEYLDSLGGELRALIDIRDGNNDTLEVEPAKTVSTETTFNSGYKGIPYYQTRLNKFATVFADYVNDLFSKGVNKDGKNPGDIFTVKYSDSPMSAANLAINDYYVEHADKLPTKYPGSDNSDQAFLDDIMSLRESPIDGFSGTTARYYLESIVSEVSVDTNKAKSFNSNFKTISETVQNQRLSVMGTDEDEEAMDLMKFQQAYNLAGHVMSILNQMYNKLINEMGV
ncbi:MAG TPA: flagellar hook-associated protein FlgK [Eubacterium sp.]|nr:flagellar hook-associated protein FlgK [Eubacterium sp.]